jgi:hypothetical protein
MSITSSPSNIFVHQSGYIAKLLSNRSVPTTYSTPSAQDFFTVTDDPSFDYSAKSTEFLSSIMELMFLATRTRPDILKEITFLASFAKNPGPIAFSRLHRIYGYLSLTASMGINLSFKDTSVHIYADAAFGLHSNGRSHSGYFITLGTLGGPILVKSSIQRLVSTSSTESELICLVDAIKRSLPIQNLLSELRLASRLPIHLHEDNLSTITIALKGEGTGGKSKFFRIRFHFIKDLIDSGKVRISHIPTEEQPADLLTKPLQRRLFIKFRSYLLNHQLDS